MVKSRKLGAEISFGFRRKVDKKKKVQLVRIDLIEAQRTSTSSLGMLFSKNGSAWLRQASLSRNAGSNLMLTNRTLQKSSK